MNNVFITSLGKTISFASKLTNRGAGSTWPGHIALSLNKNYIKDLLKDSPTKIILVVGTNGKTTTGKILTTILEKNGKKVFQNTSGANLLNGITSSLLLHSTLLSKVNADYGIFEVDENNLPLILHELTPKAIIVLDLFRDQLDRYGELDSIAKKWKNAFEKLPPSTHLILNGDDPLIASLGQDVTASVCYFGLDPNKNEGQPVQHAADSLYCPRCSNKLQFSKIFYSHLGIWKCPHCKFERPLPTIAESFYPLEGMYNRYNTLAAALAAKTLGINSEKIDTALHSVVAAFGRQEKLIVHGKPIQLFLAKNPTSFNESLKTISKMGAKHIMLVLNDRIPDGRDVSWIWDIDLEQYIIDFKHVTVSGDRTYDMALRLQYAQKTPTFSNNPNYFIEPNLKLALQKAIEQTPKNETLYILPTYSAMLDVRKILTGRKIL